MPRSRRPTASTRLAHQRKESWIGRYGGKISAEWQFAKALQLLEEDPELFARAQRWIEAADWIIWQLCGVRDPQRRHGRVQGHLPGRPVPVGGLSRRVASGLPGLLAKLGQEMSPFGGRAGV